ncbi:MAG TPA: hypothetical protein P5531_09070 [Bacteroidales bacterium]|nr:hypothetical protein [Bacteroidales bacterium]HSA44779.1 hypothetical protein [Bacteroidales bacterium]
MLQAAPACAVSGWKTYWGGWSVVEHPFLATAHIYPWPVPPGWVQVDGLYEFVNPSAYTNNFSTDVTMNISNFALYMAGCINEAGWHPLLNSGMPNPIYYPQTTPISNDFFINRFSYVPGLFNDIEWGCWAVSNSGIFSLYSDEPPFMAMASDNGYKLFFTGSYVENLQTPPAVGLNISNQSVTGCYIARLIETGSDPIIKKEPFGNLSFNGGSHQFSLFPNPCREMITVVKDELSNIPCSISFYAANGKPMDAQLVSEQPGYNCFDLRSFPPGLYCIHILTGSKAQVLKFVRI